MDSSSPGCSCTLLSVRGGYLGFHSRFSARLFWPASWLPVLDQSRGSKSAEFRRVWGIYDDRLQFYDQG